MIYHIHSAALTRLLRSALFPINWSGSAGIPPRHGSDL